MRNSEPCSPRLKGNVRDGRRSSAAQSGIAAAGAVHHGAAGFITAQLCSLSRLDRSRRPVSWCSVSAGTWAGRRRGLPPARAACWRVDVDAGVVGGVPHPDGTGAAGASGCQHDDAIYARVEPERARSAASGGSVREQLCSVSGLDCGAGTFGTV